MKSLSTLHDSGIVICLSDLFQYLSSEFDYKDRLIRFVSGVFIFNFESLSHFSHQRVVGYCEWVLQSILF